MVVRVAIIGGGAAGMSAASRAKALLGERAEVTVFEKGRWVSFALCGTPYYVGFKVKFVEDLLHYTLTEFTEKRGIKVKLGAEVAEIDPASRRLRFRSTEGEGVYEYDYLVIATGAAPKIPEEWRQFLEYENVFTLHSLDDAEKIRSYLVQSAVKHVVLVGGGYISFELSENVRALGKSVTMVEMYGYPLHKAFDEDMKDLIISTLERGGVNLKLGSAVKTFEAEGGKVRRAVLENGEAIEGDAFIFAPGIRPEVSLAKAAGIRIGETGAIWTDDHLRTNFGEIYAIGDAAETVDLVTGKRVWMPLAPAANKMGYVAGTNIAGGDMVFPGVVKTNVTAAFGTFFAGTGLTERDAAREGFKPVSAKLESRTKASYIDGGGGRVALKVVADSETGRLLGAQAVGDESAFWRVNVVAALLMKKATVWDLFYTDIGYMPLTNTAWDPLIIAARLLMRSLGHRPKQS